MSHSRKRVENPGELETQFIMRMPSEPAKIVKDLIRSGVSNFNDRVTIKLENNVRYGEVRVDHHLLHAKVVDLPTIVESLKTTDNKSFYKTADICQMMICKEENDRTTDEEMPSKSKKKGSVSNKVDKKFVWPHGITPPTKSIRTRRFLKLKKCIEDPETREEVKRLLRTDNDAVSIEWEVVNEEVEHEPGTSGGTAIKKELEETLKGIKTEIGGSNAMDIIEHEIFGGAISDSDDESINVVEINESNRLSAEQDSSRMYEFDSVQETGVSGKSFFTQFSRSNNGVSVKWEAINEEVKQESGTSGGIIKKEIDTLGSKGVKIEWGDTNSMDVDEHDSDDESINVVDTDESSMLENVNVVDIDETSRLSAEQDDSRMYESDSVQEIQFSKSMFDPKPNQTEVKGEYDVKEEPRECYATTYDVYRESVRSEPMSVETNAGSVAETYGHDHILARIQELQEHLADLRLQHQQREFEIASLDNNTLRKRFESIVEQLVLEMYEKEIELQECRDFLSNIKKEM